MLRVLTVPFSLKHKRLCKASYLDLLYVCIALKRKSTKHRSSNQNKPRSYYSVAWLAFICCFNWASRGQLKTMMMLTLIERRRRRRMMLIERKNDLRRREKYTIIVQQTIRRKSLMATHTQKGFTVKILWRYGKNTD